MESQLPASAKSKPDESKPHHVQRLLDLLTQDLADQSITPSQRAATLEQLKVYGRDPNGSDPIFTREGIEILCRYGFNSADTTTSQEALRCLANALLLVQETRQIFVDLGFAERAADKLESGSHDDEFLLARILFLTTYKTTIDLGKLLDEHRLGEWLNQAIARHARQYSRITEDLPPTPMGELALSETLKLIFNIAHFAPSKAFHFSASIPNIFKILCRRQLPSPPLQAPVTYLINALLSLDIASCVGDIFPFQDSNRNVARLVEVLDMATEVQQGKEEEFDDVGVPLLTLLRKMREAAPEHVKEYMKKRLLPSEEERDKPLGKSTTLASRLLNLTASAMTPNTREHISSLLFELSDSNPEQYVHNVGYGFASGLLMTRGFQVSPSSLTATSDTQRLVNPITGQTLDSEESVKDPLGDMTEEEKEREAEKLFVLFERHGPLSGSIRRLLRIVWTNAKMRRYRLKKTGVMDIKNPVQQALEEGRFEDLD